MGKLRTTSHRMCFGVPIFLLVQSIKACAHCSGGETFSHWEVFCAAHGLFLRMSVASVDSICYWHSRSFSTEFSPPVYSFSLLEKCYLSKVKKTVLVSGSVL